MGDWAEVSSAGKEEVIMNDSEDSVDRLVYELKERAKELNCLYDVQEILNTQELDLEEVFEGIIHVIPGGWQYPDICQAEIQFEEMFFRSPGYIEVAWVQSADILVQDSVVGKVSVSYTDEMPPLDEGPFLREERRLINTIADQLGNYLLHRRLRGFFERQASADMELKAGWWAILNMLKNTDPRLLMRISRKMINLLCWNGIKEAERLLKSFSFSHPEEGELLDQNYPYQMEPSQERLATTDDVFILASEHLSESMIIENIQQWVREDQSSFLVNAVIKPGSSLTEIRGVLERYHHLITQGMVLSETREKSVRTALIRRLVSENPHFVAVAKRYIRVDDFRYLLPNLIFPAGSHGKLGGKGAGIFLATRVLETAAKTNPIFNQIKTPKTLYIASDAIFNFMDINDLEDILEHKYLDIGQVRQEYPYVLHTFKNSPMPPDFVKELSLALDGFGEVPLIVRSSSLLEDQVGMSFAGKYKSLFIANQGSKEERLEKLIDAVAEVYASMFGPDPIEYRGRHGLMDMHEEMGILIQEVVGKKVGPYFFPAYAGVAFSQNDFRWSSRIQREDGLVRLVPGLGTRAVDRVSDDFPILIAPGKPGLRVNVSLDEVVRYSPKMIDVINLETGLFETINIRSLLKEYGSQYPNIRQFTSIITHDHIQSPGLAVDFKRDHVIFTFDGLFARTEFLKLMDAILTELESRFGHPVDIEFASDGTDFYLLQCRSQSYSEENAPAAIPTSVSRDKIIFTANRYISNGVVSNITHIVYVDPQKYSEIADRATLIAVGRAVSRLNQILPRRQFILMGPGRWGSRGDIKLGVSVTYSDIDNTSTLIEIASKRGDYVPDLSFGTHFFQDLVESSIRYLPLYPDDYGIVFNEQFLSSSENVLAEILPDYAYLSEVVRVIDVPRLTAGQVLHILMNADKNQAMALLAAPQETIELETPQKHAIPKPKEEHWVWRMRCVEGIAAHLDAAHYGVAGLYIFGSTQNATAGPQSDIDLLVHFRGTENQRKELSAWFDGWSLSLGQMNYTRTGYKTDHLLDVHIITDEDIENRTSYAVKIGAAIDPARPLTIGTGLKNT
jgi:predicted nucleotidyltransferase